jgi:predicted house-cleaning noncanonical NTP pyrophosphatase (MazG superfamily)
VSQSRPRLVKLVRERVGRFIGGDQTVTYERITDERVIVDSLRKKLLEECAEYLLDPSVGELADIYEVLRALAMHDIAVTWADVQEEARAKTRERGAFLIPVGMYVQTTASARHEGEHAA